MAVVQITVVCGMLTMCIEGYRLLKCLLMLVVTRGFVVRPPTLRPEEFVPRSVSAHQGESTFAFWGGRHANFFFVSVEESGGAAGRLRRGSF
ncbi:unnamed protein product [Protopolystoma xenopodis]|uniref:Uncharacterized protein n=1 Tax=Protopolystoma xenopodis TaxID=117903 RepID=A0A3S5A788_9PLAT|nr:unnamed protein product [Protopolystoma xenopodis]